jgi:hypothetical protein
MAVYRNIFRLTLGFATSVVIVCGVVNTRTPLDAKLQHDDFPAEQWWLLHRPWRGTSECAIDAKPPAVFAHETM